MAYQLHYQGSVKNLYQGPEDTLFEYSDRYSLFDWGEMPDHLDRKGEALAVMGALFFHEVEKLSVPHHFISLADQAGASFELRATRYLKVKTIPVHRPGFNGTYDYSFFQTRPQEGLVPLEVMFRFGAGKGSSLAKRVSKEPSLLRQWNLSSLEEEKLWDLPLIDFSTKLEKGDRYLSHAEAMKIAGLSGAEAQKLMDQTIKVALMLRGLFNDMGLDLWDGKLEWAFLPGAERDFMLVDSIGLDELRLQKKDCSLSKEFLREYYRQTPWYQTLAIAKERALRSGQDFKKLCIEQPPELSQKIKEKAEALYLGFANDLARKLRGRPVFEEHFTLKGWEKA